MDNPNLKTDVICRWNEVIKYREYMASQYWLKLKKERFTLDCFMCVLCKSKKKLLLHHITYSRLYSERMTDVITLCTKCHSRIHRISKIQNQPWFVSVSAMYDIDPVTPGNLKTKFDDIW